jgi:hypothetical protein
VFQEFGTGGTGDQLTAVRILGQIDSPLSSKLLAVLAIYGKTPEVRRSAMEVLRGRDPNEYLAIVVNLLVDPVKYQARPVNGPGSTGLLLIEGDHAIIRRFYDVPLPRLNFNPGVDTVGIDNSGMPYMYHPLGIGKSTLISRKGTLATGTTSVYEDTHYGTSVSPSEVLAAGQQGAMLAQQQLESDVAQLEAFNEVRRAFNEHLIAIAKFASNKDFGSEPKEWRDKLAALGRYRQTPNQQPIKPTFDELVPLPFLPIFGHLSMVNVKRIVTTPPDN